MTQTPLNANQWPVWGRASAFRGEDGKVRNRRNLVITARSGERLFIIGFADLGYHALPAGGLLSSRPTLWQNCLRASWMEPRLTKMDQGFREVLEILGERLAREGLGGS